MGAALRAPALRLLVLFATYSYQHQLLDQPDESIRVQLVAHSARSHTYADAMTAKDTKLKLEWKTGVAATDWDDIAKKENLDLMATELRRLEDTVKEIHNEMLYLRKREEQMRNLNGVASLTKRLPNVSKLVTRIAVTQRLPDFDGVPCNVDAMTVTTSISPDAVNGQPCAKQARLRMSAADGIWLRAEATNARVAFYSITSLVVCVVLGLWQLWHLRSFFQRKKLL